MQWYVWKWVEHNFFGFECACRSVQTARMKVQRVVTCTFLFEVDCWMLDPMKGELLSCLHFNLSPNEYMAHFCHMQQFRMQHSGWWHLKMSYYIVLAHVQYKTANFSIKWGACTARHEGCYQFLSIKQSNWFSFGQGEWMDSSSDKEVIELEWPTKKLKLGICIHRIAEGEGWVHSCWALYSLKNCGLLENCICSPSLFLADCVVETTKLRVEKLLILTHPWSVHWQHILVEFLC